MAGGGIGLYEKGGSEASFAFLSTCVNLLPLTRAHCEHGRSL